MHFMFLLLSLDSSLSEPHSRYFLLDFKHAEGKACILFFSTSSARKAVVHA